MRNFDLRNVFFDDDGNRLYGKILFTEKDSSGGQTIPNLKPIFAKDGTTQLSNPIYTTLDGVSANQVFLDDGDYSVWFYKYVGNGVMEDDDDQENWEKVNFTPFDVLDPMGNTILDISSRNIIRASNIAELQTLYSANVPANPSGERIVMLEGYYTSGDKRPVMYKYVYSNASHNGGSVIRSGDTSYKWMLVDEDSAVNVLDWGVFPNTGNAVNSQLANANYYAYLNQKDVYFPKGEYIINGGSIETVKNVILDGAFFTCKRNTIFSFGNIIKDESENVFLCENNATCTVESDDIKTSWVQMSYTSFTARKKIIADVSKTFSASNVIVFDEGNNTTYCTFTNCIVVGNGEIRLVNGNKSIKINVNKFEIDDNNRFTSDILKASKISTPLAEITRAVISGNLECGSIDVTYGITSNYAEITNLTAGNANLSGQIEVATIKPKQNASLIEKALHLETPKYIYEDVSYATASGNNYVWGIAPTDSRYNKKEMLVVVEPTELHNENELKIIGTLNNTILQRITILYNLKNVSTYNKNTMLKVVFYAGSASTQGVHLTTLSPGCRCTLQNVYNNTLVSTSLSLDVAAI